MTEQRFDEVEVPVGNTITKRLLTDLQRVVDDQDDDNVPTYALGALLINAVSALEIEVRDLQRQLAKLKFA